MTAHETLSGVELTQITGPAQMPAGLRRELVACWVEVVNAGGAVIPHGVGLPPVTFPDVERALDRIVHALDPRHARLLVATADSAAASWLLLRRDPHPLVAHCGVVNHLQTHPRRRSRGIGAVLMRHARRVARDEMGLERLGLTVRDGLGLENFYAGLGWVEVGRWPGALRVAPGDDRDEILMSLRL